MPQATIQLFREKDGEVPLVEWLDGLEARHAKAYASCLHAISELERLGFEAQRPLAAPLRDHIYELRVKVSRVLVVEQF